MGLPAEIRLIPLDGMSDPDRDRLGAELAVLLEEWRASRPSEGSAIEDELIRRWMGALADQRSVVSAFIERGLSGWARELTAEQLTATTSTERQLAVRWMWRALETMERLLAVAEQAGGESSEVLSRVLLGIAVVAPSSLALEERRAISFQLDFFVALELLDEAAPTELAFFSQRAYRSGIKLESWLNTALHMTRLRGEFVRERARHAWEDWDEQDLADEVAAWPQPE